ncbi:MAG: GntR family transcriptional regulator [Candidatus Aminicenantes bacterium]|nr:MAG: GntR family transcriptional regulator [Candidatus Aminicenantes bacterium]
MQNKIERVALRDLVHRNVLERILQGHLPPGSRVKDTDLSEELQVSRTPVREALVRLVKEGFLENLVGRGFMVRPLTSQEVQDIYPIIWTLETLALKTSEPLPHESLEYFEKISDEMKVPQSDFIRLIELDKEWHKTLLSGCGNQRLLDMIRDLKAIAFRYEYAYMQNQDLVKSSIQEHEKIVNTLFREGHEAVVPLLVKHWESSMHALLEKVSHRRKKW